PSSGEYHPDDLPGAGDHPTGDHPPRGYPRHEHPTGGFRTGDADPPGGSASGGYRDPAFDGR
ncbi:MAG TPA: hypothetical protein VGP05_03855, partial [Pseudonocardia sp.]|nr:hypothetical protein [Pseudonocardia sp.]